LDLFSVSENNITNSISSSLSLNCCNY